MTLFEILRFSYLKFFSSFFPFLLTFLQKFLLFSAIKKLKLTLNPTDISSDEIERIIDPYTNLFDNLEEFELIDLSKCFGIFGIFLGLFKNFRNIKRISLKTDDRNLKTILEECLPKMIKLEELKLTSSAAKSAQIIKIVEKFSPKLKSFYFNDQIVEF